MALVLPVGPKPKVQSPGLGSIASRVKLDTNTLCVIGALVLLGIGLGFSGVGRKPVASASEAVSFERGVAPGTAPSGAWLSTLATMPSGSQIAVSGTVTEFKLAGDGRPLLTISTDHGWNATVYVSDDAEAQPVFIGNKYEFAVTVQGQLLVANIKDGVRKLSTTGSSQATTANVWNGYASVTDAGGTRIVPAPNLPNGVVDGHLETVEGHLVFSAY